MSNSKKTPLTKKQLAILDVIPIVSQKTFVKMLFPDPAQASASQGCCKVEETTGPPTAGANPASGAKVVIVGREIDMWREITQQWLGGWYDISRELLGSGEWKITFVRTK